MMDTCINMDNYSVQRRQEKKKNMKYDLNYRSSPSKTIQPLN